MDESVGSNPADLANTHKDYMKQNIKQKVSETILESPLEVVVGKKTYTVAPPTGGTLIMVSELLGDTAPIDSGGNMLYEVLATAKNCRYIYDVMATLILGAKVIRGIGGRRKMKALSDELRDTCTNKQVHKMMLDILEKMEVRDFFTISVSLREIGLIQIERETVTTTTQSGASSPAS